MKDLRSRLEEIWKQKGCRWPSNICRWDQELISKKGRLTFKSTYIKNAAEKIKYRNRRR